MKMKMEERGMRERKEEEKKIQINEKGHTKKEKNEES
jgi:hypothetical protein